MSVDAYRFVWGTCKAKGAKKLMMLALADFTNSDTGECFPSIPTLAKMLCINERNASAALHGLAKDNLIEIRHHDGMQTGTGKTNRYYFVGFKEWKKHHDKADNDYEQEMSKSTSLHYQGMSKSSSLKSSRDVEIIRQGMSKSSSKPVLEPEEINTNTSSGEDVTVSHSDTSTTTDYQHYFGAIAKGAFEISDLKGISPNSRKRIGALAKIAQQLIAARQPDISAEQGAALVTKFCAAETFKSNLQGAPKFELNFAAWLEKNAPHIPGYLRSLNSAPKIIPDDDAEYVDPEEVKRVLAETMAALKANAAKREPEAVA